VGKLDTIFTAAAPAHGREIKSSMQLYDLDQSSRLHQFLVDRFVGSCFELSSQVLSIRFNQTKRRDNKVKICKYKWCSDVVTAKIMLVFKIAL
jgi:hypothetical protein